MVYKGLNHENDGQPMFKRRQKLPLRRKIREAVWPSMGWRRVYYYWRHRIFRGGDSTYSVVAGLASGAAISFSPFFGTHVMQAFFLAWLFRANWIAAFIGTAFGNPTTLPFLLWIAYKVGVFILDLSGFSGQFALPTHFTLGVIFHEPLRLLLPLTVGSLACGAVTWPAVYALLFYPVRARAGSIGCSAGTVITNAWRRRDHRHGQRPDRHHAHRENIDALRRPVYPPLLHGCRDC